MNPETLEALKGSIEKWRKIVEEGGEDRGSDNCPLCHLFLEGRHSCSGCPIDAHTGCGCDNAAFRAWCAADTPGLRAATPEAMAAAQAELAFLRSLLPKEEKAE